MPTRGISARMQQWTNLGGLGERIEGVVLLGSCKLDTSTYASLLRQCGDVKSLKDGKRLHGHLIRNGLYLDKFIGNLLVEMYGKCGSLQDARAALEDIVECNVFSWNIMIAAYARNGHGREALDLYQEMDMEGTKPDKVTFVSVIRACSSTGTLAEGKAIHARLIGSPFESDVVVGTALLNMYGKFRSLNDARAVFDKMPMRNVVSWTAMIAAYAQNGYSVQAIELFHMMDLEGVKSDEIAFIEVLEACSTVGNLAMGKTIHARIVAGGFDSEVIMMNALLNMYGKCQSLGEARSVFSKMRRRTLVSWNAMVAAYAQNGHPRDALKLFRIMDLEGVNPDDITFISVLDACSLIEAGVTGNAIHARMDFLRLQLDGKVGTALVNMYGKCGNLDHASMVFKQMRQRDNVSWTAIIAAHAQHGHTGMALSLFSEMSLDGMAADEVVLVSVLFACSHAGLLDLGQDYFVSMSTDYRIEPTLDHYLCMIDLLGRSGRLDDAEDLINCMPFEPDNLAWMTILGACRRHSNHER